MNSINDALDILNSFERMAYQKTFNAIPDWVITIAQNIVNQHTNLQLTTENIERLLQSDLPLITQIQQMGLDSHSPARFALLHSAKRVFSAETGSMQQESNLAMAQ